MNRKMSPDTSQAKSAAVGGMEADEKHDATVGGARTPSEASFIRTPVSSTIRFVGAVCVLLYPLVLAQSQPVVSFDHTTFGGSIGQDQVQGWEFVPRVDLAVLQLGLYDGRPAGGFQQAHSVAIWDINRNLITSAVFPEGELAPLQGDFRYVDIPSISLSAGERYVIGAFMPGPVTDYTLLWERVALSNGIVTIDPRVEFLAYRAGLSPGSISFPESRWEDYVGAFGPNFVIAVPEPGTFVLVWAALAVSVPWIVRNRRIEKTVSHRSDLSAISPPRRRCS